MRFRAQGMLTFPGTSQRGKQLVVTATHRAGAEKLGPPDVNVILEVPGSYCN